MTAREKFIARLKELGLESQYGPDDHVGCFLEDGSIVVLVHIQSDPSDAYSEFRYPPFEEMWKDARFREECKQNFYDHDDDHFVAELAYWLDIHKNGAECPLSPVDAYWSGAPASEWFNYEDDAPINLYGREWQELIGPFKPDEPRDWLVAKLSEGDMWINNESGTVYLVKPDGNYLMSCI